jgi:hypothetical protein
VSDPAGRGAPGSTRTPRAPHATGRVSARARAALDALHDKGLNFDVAARGDATPAHGWHVDAHCSPLPAEPPGPPQLGGSWEVARGVLERYEFADPGIVRAVYFPDDPLVDRDMVLEARFFGLRFLLGLRVGGVNDDTAEVDGRSVRRWGWNYRTLEGHLEMGQMDYEVWKWLDSGDVEFRIAAWSKPARIRNPLVRLGFRLFGRRMQLRFAHRALARMRTLVEAELAGRPPGVTPAVAAIDVRPAASSPRAHDHLDRQHR